MKAAQQLTYPDEERVEEVVAQLSSLPPLVTSWEIERLKEGLAQAAEGRCFLLQGGDCAESFDDCTSDSITSKLKILLQMSLVLVHSSKRPVLRVGRFVFQETGGQQGVGVDHRSGLEGVEALDVDDAELGAEDVGEAPLG